MTPNRNGGSKLIAVLNIRPGAAAYGVTPAHVAIRKRDNAVSFAFWRSEPNRILRVLKYQPSLRVLSFDSAIRRVFYRHGHFAAPRRTASTVATTVVTQIMRRTFERTMVDNTNPTD